VTHTILKGAEWVLQAERAEGAPEAIYSVACLTCTAESGRFDNDPKPVSVWAINHTRQLGAAHCQFIVTTEKHWRVDRVRGGGGNGERTMVLPRVHARPGARGGHARPRARWSLRRLLRRGSTR
jgi:hypothetical protein